MSSTWDDRLARLPAPDVRTSLRVVTMGMNFDSGYATFVAKKVLPKLRQGLHGLPWYLRWMTYHYSPAREAVMLRRNMLTSERALTDFHEQLDASVAVRYERLLAVEIAPSRLDAPSVLVYDHLVRGGHSEEAERWLDARRARIAGEYLGIPYIRCVLQPRTETRLWTLAKCQPGHCSQP